MSAHMYSAANPAEPTMRRDRPRTLRVDVRRLHPETATLGKG